MRPSEINPSIRVNRDAWCFRAREHVFPLGKKTYIMGILNITPDSFSDGGRYSDLEKAAAHARAMIEAGADILDVGGESTRPGSTPVSEEEEIRRILPVLKRLSSECRIPISVDTWKSGVARAAVDAGASVINDVWGARRDPEIATVASECGAGLILMFNAFDPELVNMTGDILADATRYLTESVRIARTGGVGEDRIMLDPGIGFGMSTDESLRLIAGIPQILSLGFPVLVGPSRKRFIGATLDVPVEERMPGTLGVCSASAMLGANIVRVHDVRETAQAVRMVDAIRAASEE